MKKRHVSLSGETISLAELDKDETELLRVVREFAKATKDWNAYRNFWMKKVGDFYDKRGISRSAAIETAVFRVAQDLGGRIAVSQGLARLPKPNPTYREQLMKLIMKKFRSRRAFCKATGISEDLLSHVLSGRKHLAIDTLSKALDKIGYRLRITPIEKPASKHSA